MKRIHVSLSEAMERVGNPNQNPNQNERGVLGEALETLISAISMKKYDRPPVFQHSESWIEKIMRIPTAVCLWK